MNNIKSIKFLLKRRTKVDSLTGMNVMTDKHLLIVMRVVAPSFSSDLSTGLHVDLSDWDEEKQTVKPNCKDSEAINDGMEMMKLIFKSCLRMFEQERIEPTKEEIIQKFHKMTKAVCDLFAVNKSETDTMNGRIEERSVIFWKALDRFRNENNVFLGWGKSTREKFHSLKTHMETFVTMKRKKNNKFCLTFDFLTKEGLDEYCEFVQTNYGLRNVTMKKHIEFLRWFLRWAVAMGYTQNIAFESYRPKLRCQNRKVIYLTVEELRSLTSLHFNTESENENIALEHARYVFLFMCLTGLRYSDVKNLKRCDVYDGGLVITTVKTNDNLSVNLNRFSYAILKKYENVQLPDGAALPVTSNQKLNEHIHKICKMAGITQSVRMTYYKEDKRIDEVKPKWQWVSSQTGRKTFVCLALSLGIDRDTIMKWTGHKDYKSMAPYVDITDKHKSEAMKSFNALPLEQIITNGDSATQRPQN